MKEVRRAENAGFCFGVKQAIEKAEKAAEESGGKIYSMGSLIHNERVTEDLKKRGVEVIESLDEIPDFKEQIKVIIRSHGEGKEFYEEAEVRNIDLVDATCPFVAKIHKLVNDTEKQVIIVGDEKHPEVLGISGWCRKPAVVVNSREDAENVEGDDLFIVTQTTIREKTLNDVLSVFDEKHKAYQVNNTICSATAKRQKSCKELAADSDLMIVIGDRHSSNTKKLYEISKKNCANSYFVENIDDLPLKELKKCNRIGIAAGASTPECTIKEVIARMSDVTLENNELNMNDLMDEIEKSLRLPRGGEIVTGKVHQVTDKEVIVNLGCKKDGILPISEVSLEEGQTLADAFKVDDEIQAKVIKTDDGDGGILLSKKKLEISANWDEIVKAFEDKTVLEVKVTRPVNGGVIAEYKEVSGFIPLSQLSDHYVENAEKFIGQTMEVRVSRVDQRRNRAVFSHKLFLNEEKEKLVAEIWGNLNVEDVVEGTVMRFTDYGAFVDIGGIDGLLHISEISWGKLKHPQEVLSIGQKINVKVLSMNEEKGKISLGLKQNQPEPWSVIDENYQIGQVIEGKVVQIKEYGAFVELEPGLDGLVHISEVAHKRVGNINDELEIGQIVKAKILEIDKERKRISLSIRETIDPPMEDEKEAAPATPEAEMESVSENQEETDTTADVAAETETAADADVSEEAVEENVE